MAKKKIGIPLAKYFGQIRHKAEQYGYKLSGEVIIELPNSDCWIYHFTKDNKKSKEKNEEELPDIQVDSAKMEHLEKGAQLKKEKDLRGII